MWNLVITLLVFGIIAGGIYEGYEQYESGSNTQSAQNLTMETAQSMATMDTVYSGNANFTSLTNQSASTDQIAPSSWSYAAGAGFTLPEGGTASFAPTAINGAAVDNGYTLTLSNLKPSECATLAAYHNSSTVSISVNGTSASNPSFSGGTGTWPQNLAGDCTTGGTNTVIITQIGK